MSEDQPTHVLVDVRGLNTEWLRAYARQHSGKRNRPMAAAAQRIGQALDEQDKQ